MLNINHDKKEISLGMKQCQSNPWDEVAKQYPTGTTVSGVVRNLTSYGAFIEIEEGIDGLLHVSDMSWVRKVTNPGEVVQKGQKLTCVGAVASIRNASASPWASSRWATTRGKATSPAGSSRARRSKARSRSSPTSACSSNSNRASKACCTSPNWPSRRSSRPEDVVKVGDEVDVKVLRVDAKDRKIGLSMKNVDDDQVPEDAQIADLDDPNVPTESKKDKDKGDRTGLRGGTGAGGLLIQMPGSEE